MWPCAMWMRTTQTQIERENLFSSIFLLRLLMNFVQKIERVRKAETMKQKKKTAIGGWIEKSSRVCEQIRRKKSDTLQNSFQVSLVTWTLTEARSIHKFWVDFEKFFPWRSYRKKGFHDSRHDWWKMTMSSNSIGYPCSTITTTQHFPADHRI